MHRPNHSSSVHQFSRSSESVRTIFLKIGTVVRDTLLFLIIQVQTTAMKLLSSEHCFSTVFPLYFLSRLKFLVFFGLLRKYKGNTVEKQCSLS